MEDIGETVSVLASFGPSYKMQPVRFSWNGRTLAVKEITYRWTSMDGEAVLHHFSVTDGSTLFQLTFNAATLLWSLDRVET